MLVDWLKVIMKGTVKLIVISELSFSVMLDCICVKMQEGVWLLANQL